MSQVENLWSDTYFVLCIEDMVSRILLLPSHACHMEELRKWCKVL
jgi:hypothetical protein